MNYFPDEYETAFKYAENRRNIEPKVYSERKVKDGQKEDKHPIPSIMKLLLKSMSHWMNQDGWYMKPLLKNYVQ